MNGMLYMCVCVCVCVCVCLSVCVAAQVDVGSVLIPQLSLWSHISWAEKQKKGEGELKDGETLG